MEASLLELRNARNLNVSSVAESHGVSRKSLNERMLGNIEVNASPGKKSYLTHEEELYLVSWLIDMSAIGLGYDIKTMKKMISTLLVKDSNPLTNGWVPWVQYFLQKYPEISLRKSKAFDRLRLRSLDEDVISRAFVVLQMVF